MEHKLFSYGLCVLTFMESCIVSKRSAPFMIITDFSESFGKGFLWSFALNDQFLLDNKSASGHIKVHIRCSPVTQR